MQNIFRTKDCPVFLTGKTDSVTDSAYFPAGVGMMKFFQCPGRNEEIIPKNSIFQVKKISGNRVTVSDLPLLLSVQGYSA